MGNRLYGPLRNSRDVKTINKKIRGQIRRAKTRARIIELLKRSQYLITLTYSPSVSKGIRRHGGSVLRVRRTARREYLKTRKLALKKLRRLRRR
jgi:hypothetical protein